MTSLVYASLLAAGVFATYLLNHALGFPSGSSAWAFYLPNGLALAFFMRRPRREWLPLSVGLLVGKQLASILSRGEIWTAVDYQVGLANVVEVWLAAWSLLWLAPRPVEVPDFRRILLFLLVGVVLAPIVPAAIAAHGWSRVGAEEFLPLARTFYVGDSLGLLIATPVILAWWWPSAEPRCVPADGTPLEAVALAIATLLVSVAIFGASHEAFQVKPIPYLVMPLLMWGVSRFGLRGGTSQIAAVALVAVALTARDHGPFVAGDIELNSRVAALQLFLSVVAASTLLLGSLMGQRARLEVEQRKAETLTSLGELAARVAHDFNNYLTAIVGWSHTLSGQNDPHIREEATREIKRAAEQARLLTRQLLAFGRGGFAEPTDLVPAQLVRELEPILRSSGGSRHELIFELGAEPWFVSADPHDIEIALINLVANAGDAMPDGGKITVGVANEGGRPDGTDHVALFVRDEGPGIAPEDRERIFEPFFSTKTKRDGTGLGLVTVQRVAGRQGGTVRVKPANARGAQFEIVLPRVLDPKPSAEGEVVQADR